MTLDSLFDADVHQAVKRRLAALQPDSQARWGLMSAHQAVCHLADAFRMVLGERPIAFRGNLRLKTVIRFMALTLPVPWPKGSKGRRRWTGSAAAPSGAGRRRPRRPDGAHARRGGRPEQPATGVVESCRPLSRLDSLLDFLRALNLGDAQVVPGLEIEP